ncbi:interleukin-13 receptor subunit alpha-2 [Hoplias malabaricus]|uniref:interleukin-13 receptor subunit alpha-2 n=1 Tax=Hoplias malabaricus TaxID=27720 RepID=UPI0034630884
MTTALLWMCFLLLVLLIQHSSFGVEVAGLSVDPPANIKIKDPGHLGHLIIEWSRPSRLQNLSDCSVRYQLRFYDTYTGRWRSVRTMKLSYEAQFDLEKPIQLKMLTLVKGPCTSGVEVLGKEEEFVETFEHKGIKDSRIRDFQCVYYNKEYMDCKWRPGSADTPDSNHKLYYWHREMQETAECPEYFPDTELWKGCRFPRASLLEFTEFNVCVNGSSREGDLLPAYFSLEVQNKVKPKMVSNVELLTKDGLLQVHWSPPTGNVPEQCLEYELEGTNEFMDGSKRKWTNVSEETTIEFVRNGESEKSCFRVRSKINGYCADEGFWSEWSPTVCFPDNEKVKKHETHLEQWSTIVLTSNLILTALIFCLIAWALKKMWMNRKQQKYVFDPLFKEKVQKAMPPILSPVFH